MEDLELNSIKPGTKEAICEDAANEMFSAVLESMQSKSTDVSMQDISVDAYIVDHMLSSGKFSSSSCCQGKLHSDSPIIRGM